MLSPSFSVETLLSPWILLVGISVYCFLRFTNASRLPLPPGPKTPWFGFLSLPSSYPWLVYDKWKQEYGDLIYIRVLGNPVLVLNSASAASDLLETRGYKYSSRPYRVMVLDLMGCGWMFSSMAYGDRWKRHRNLFHKHFRPNDSPLYSSLQAQETHILLRSLLLTPENYRNHIRKAAAAIILNLTYGQQLADHGEDYFALSDEAIRTIASAGIFGTYLVDYLPILKYVPSWFPFASFKIKARKWRKTIEKLVNTPYDLVKDRMIDGSATHSLVSIELEKIAAGVDAEDEDIIKNVAATTFIAGADTVVSAILSFVLVMTIHPEIQKQAQQEVDRVASGRLPCLADKADMPLIQSICHELLRWNPVTNLSLAHYVTEDDEYNGYYIPKGTTVLPNVWAILHDPDMYPDPMTFQADRFLNPIPGVNEKPEAAFGFGRRICPGRWLAYDFLFIVVASMLAVYDISKELDENGKPIDPEVKYTPFIVSHPMPFKCRILPRSPASVLLTEQTMLAES